VSLRAPQAWARQEDSESVMRLVRWVLLVTLGEAVGFSVPVAIGVAVTAVSWGPLATLLAMVLAGSVEGAALGVAQADCLFRWEVLPVRRWWVAATSIGAAVAWSLGMLPSILAGLKWSAGTVVAAAVGALILLSSLPLAQYVVLRDHVRPSARWIPINMAAWLVGIVWTLLPSPWVDQSTSAGALIFIYGIAGLCMAATVAVITGSGMIRLLRPVDAARSASLARSEHAKGVLEGTPQPSKEREFS
jgi:hypothetical protein